VSGCRWVGVYSGTMPSTTALTAARDAAKAAYLVAVDQASYSIPGATITRQGLSVLLEHWIELEDRLTAASDTTGGLILVEFADPE